MEKNESAVDVRRIYRALALEEELDGVDLRVFLYLFSKLDFKTFIPVPQMEIAEALGKHKEHVSRSIKKLKAMHMILPGPNVNRSSSFRLNPHYGK
jgi:phage regulator Rha-like protein